MLKPDIVIFRRLGIGRGRDFIVGDIHGMFHLVREALERLKFDPTVDRLFCVGDLVDRGPYSDAALEFLKEPWVYAVRGNHEQMFLDLYASGKLDERALAFNVKHNGAGWWLELSEERRREHLKAYAALPLAIEVSTLRGTVGLLHAEVPRGMSWRDFTELLEVGDEEAIQSALWGRTRLTEHDTQGVPGIGRIFSGHTILRQVTRLGNIFFLDTGAFQRLYEDDGGLSVSNLVACSQVLSGNPTSRGTWRLNLVETAKFGPFGNYTK